MVNDEFKKIRDEAVASMQEQLRRVDPVDMPYWVLMTLMVPIFMAAALAMTGRMLWTLVKTWLLSPFVFVAAWTDMLVIFWWFLRSTVERMTRR